MAEDGLAHWYGGSPLVLRGSGAGGLSYWLDGFVVWTIPNWVDGAAAIAAASAPEFFSELALFSPVATTDAGGWTTQVGGSDLHAVLDEEVRDDADYIRSSEDPSADVSRIELEVGEITADPTRPVVAKYAIGKIGAGAAGSRIDLTVRVVQGVVVAAEWTHEDVPAGPELVTRILTDEERDLVNWDGPTPVEIEFEASKV